jgi:hypothetical protein
VPASSWAASSSRPGPSAAAVHAVVGRVAPDHRLVGRREPLLVARRILVFLGCRLPARPARATRRAGQFDHVDDAARVGLDELEEPPHLGPAGGRRVGRGELHAAGRRRQPHRPRLADRIAFEERSPVDEQAHRAVGVPLVEQRRRRAGMRAG